MSPQVASIPGHPQSETVSVIPCPLQDLALPSLTVDTVGRRFHVEWDPLAPVTPMGQLVFFSQFLGSSGLYSNWVKNCPLHYDSPNAPLVGDVLGTSLLAVLNGASRYSHVTALRGDKVNPKGLGMEKVVSEDSLRRAFAKESSEAVAHWQLDALLASYAPALEQPWIAVWMLPSSRSTAIRREHNWATTPTSPGVPVMLITRSFCALCAWLWMWRRARGTSMRRPMAWRIYGGCGDKLTPAQRPWLVCGDAGYGNQRMMSQCEERGQKYLFRQRNTRGVEQMIRMLECQGGWQAVRDGWEGSQGELQLTGWTCKRRAVVFRRRQSVAKAADVPLLDQSGLDVKAGPVFEYVILVTNLSENLLTLLHLYQQRADVENAYDELKNQWGWGGFTTRDILRCQIAARTVGLVYNWWSLFVRCADPKRAREAITSRPLLLCSVGRITTSGGQTTLRLTSNHAEAAKAQELLTNLSLFLSGLNNTAEQLSSEERWRRIWRRILEPYRQPAAGALGPSG